MARLKNYGAEFNSVTAGVELSAVTAAAPTISSTTVRSGTYSLRCQNTGTAIRADLYMSGSNQSTIGYLRAYVRFASFPGASTAAILQFRDISGAIMAEIVVGSAGALRLRDSSSTNIGSGSANLSTGVWYRIELKNDATTNPGMLTARYVACDANGVDPGTGEITIATGANNVRGSWGRASLAASGTNAFDVFFDDVAVNDSTGANQTSWPGPEKLVLLTPNGDGDSHQWLDNAGSAGTANNYTLVDDVPPNDATDYVQSGLAGDTASAADLYNLTNSGIGFSDIVNVVTVHARFADITAAVGTTAFKLQIEKAGSGTKTQSGALVPNSTTWRTDDVGNSIVQGVPPIVAYVDPDGNSWTQATLDSMQAGPIITTTGLDRIGLTFIAVYVGYTPVGALPPTRPLLGVGL